MNYTLVTDASFCRKSGIATGAAVFQNEDGVGKTVVWELDAKDSSDAELQALVKGIQLVPKEANLTAFTDVKYFSRTLNKIIDKRRIKKKLVTKMKSLTKVVQNRSSNTEVMWTGDFGEDHQLLGIVHKAAYKKMRSLRGPYKNV